MLFDKYYIDFEQALDQYNTVSTVVFSFNYFFQYVKERFVRLS
jgi:hypothetical protein